MRAPPPVMTDRTDWPDAWTLFLDIDGTLLDLAPRPELVMVPPDLPPVCAGSPRPWGAPWP
jgi:hypothetical protein